MNVNNVIRVPMGRDELMRSWLVMLGPMHGLKGRELDLAVLLLERAAGDPDIEVSSPRLKEQLRATLGINAGYLRTMLSRLRKAGFLLKDGTLNKRFMPDYTGGGRFRLLIDFVIDDRRG